MNRCLMPCLLGLTLTTPVFAQDRTPRHARYPQWITDYEAARRIARAAGKPLFVVLRCEP